MGLRETHILGQILPHRSPISSGLIQRAHPCHSKEGSHLFNRPLNSIGMPYFDEPLFSSWPRYLSSRNPHYPPPPTIPPTILLSMKTNDNIAYAALPKELKGRRNMVTTPATRQTNSRFRSGKTSSGVCSLPASPLILTCSQSNWNTLIPAHKDGDIPRAYCRVEIEYSKFGVEDFDFECVHPALSAILLIISPVRITRRVSVVWRHTS